MVPRKDLCLPARTFTWPAAVLLPLEPGKSQDATPQECSRRQACLLWRSQCSRVLKGRVANLVQTSSNLVNLGSGQQLPCRVYAWWLPATRSSDDVIPRWRVSSNHIYEGMCYSSNLIRIRGIGNPTKMQNARLQIPYQRHSKLTLLVRVHRYREVPPARD